MVRQGKILGHIALKNKISMDMDKIQVILNLLRPINAKGIQCFMGRCGYYQQFIYMYAKPIYSLITAFKWIEECET